MEGPPADSSFKFTLRDDRDFNHTVFVDVLAIDGKNVLQVIDEATASQAARFLTNMSAGCTWNTLKECWIDFYLGPPAYVVHDAGTNFASKEFRDNARVMNVEPKEVPVEAHNSIGLVEQYHIPLRRAYDIISQEVPSITKEHKRFDSSHVTSILLFWSLSSGHSIGGHITFIVHFFTNFVYTHTLCIPFTIV